jgi:hypothetical protein
VNYRKIGFGLGLFSVVLGALEIAAAHRLSQALDEEGDHDALLKTFGARDVLSGINLLTAPAAATNVWGRVAGDAMDIAALGAAARKNPGKPATWGALAFVAGATLLDVMTALGLDRETGKTLPTHPPLPS